MKKNRAIISDKELLSEQIIKIAKSCKSLNELSEKLKQYSITPYDRNGKLTGVWFGNRKYRLTTLGVGKEHLKKLTIEQQRLDGLYQLRQSKERNKELEQ